MKTTLKFIIAAMAAISVFSSCQKELANETVNNTTGGVRTIAVQFDNSTKATLDGFTPKFANSDAIRVSDTEKSEVCTVSVDGSGNATFSTTLSGDLTAIYPADAAVFTGNGHISSPYFKVSASQDGDVAKAIIAKAEIADGSTSSTFIVQTALFQITPPDGVKNFTITSLKPVVDGVARTGTATAINTDGATDAAKLVITVSNNDLTTFYVALVPGVNLSDLSFEYITDATNGLGAMKGIPAKDITAAGKTDATAANTKYTIGKTNWHPYVTIDGKKWATMNIGATSETEAGHYFAWGYTEGCVRNLANDGWVPKQFNTTDFPKRDASSFQDAATANWGGSWRMPTRAEFEALGKGTWVTSPGSGRQFGTSPNQIFFPAAGYGYGTSLTNANAGHYWSSSLYTTDPISAIYLHFLSGDAYVYFHDLYFGQPVRALSE